MATVTAMPASSRRQGVGRSRRTTAIAAAFILFAIVLPWIPPFNGQDYQRYLIGAAYTAALAVAFDFTAGYIDIVNFGFAAFVGIGAYTSGLLAVDFGLPPGLGVIAGAMVAGLVGLATGMLTLRLRGIYAAVMAWFVGLALMGLVRNLTDITRGSMGLNVPRLLGTDDNLPYYYVMLALLLVTLAVLTYVIRSNVGLAFRAIGQNLQAARASGINPLRFLVLNFTLSCAFAGLMGGFYAHYYTILTPDLMSTTRTIEVLAVAYIGGRGSLWGPAIIAFPLYIGTELLRTQLASLPGLHLVLYGLLLIVVMVYWPGGVAGVVRRVALWWERRSEKTDSTAAGA